MERSNLIMYLETQLSHFFPDGVDCRNDIEAHLDESLCRLEKCINAVRCWRKGQFDYLHSSQYCIFLYFLANTIFEESGYSATCTKLFLLNKALNGIDLFYEIAMPDIFFIGHSVGLVLAKAKYGNYLVLYQNATVGKNHGTAPTLGEGVILYPNAAIIGNCHIGDGSVIAQGVSVINRDTPGNCFCFQGQSGDLQFKPTERSIIADFFRV